MSRAGCREPVILPALGLFGWRPLGAGLLVATVNQALQSLEGVSEAFQNIGRAETVTRGVVGRVDRVHDDKHWLIHLRKRVVGPGSNYIKLH
jgi:hypothetical protein